MSGLRKLECDEIVQIMWRRRLEELIDGGDNFVFNAFLYLEPVQRFEKLGLEDLVAATTA